MRKVQEISPAEEKARTELINRMNPAYIESLNLRGKKYQEIYAKFCALLESDRKISLELNPNLNDDHVEIVANSRELLFKLTQEHGSGSFPFHQLMDLCAVSSYAAKILLTDPLFKTYRNTVSDYSLYGLVFRWPSIKAELEPDLQKKYLEIFDRYARDWDYQMKAPVTVVWSIPSYVSQVESQGELDFLNSLIKTIVPRSEKFKFSKKTKATEVDSYRLTLKPEEMDLVREMTRVFTDLGVNANFQFKGHHPLCILDCAAIKLLKQINPMQKITLMLEDAQTAAGYCVKGAGFEFQNEPSLREALVFYQEAVRLGSKKAIEYVERVNKKIDIQKQSVAVDAMKKGFGPGFVGIQDVASQKEKDQHPRPELGFGK